MKLRTVFVLAAIAAATAGCTAAGGSGSKALPAGSAKFPTPTVTTAPAPVPVHVTVTTVPAPAAKSCDVVREALLTGTPAEIAASMNRLVADRSAPVDAREAARSYMSPASYTGLTSDLVASVHKSWGDLVTMDCS